jgi:hypothetical protein
VPPTREPGSEDRRSAQRFTILCELEYRVLGLGHAEGGSGITVDMSSSGLLLATDRVLSPGLKVELQIHWPAKLDGRVRLKLVVFGKVIRVASEGAMQAGVRIERYEFRTHSP